MDHNTRQGGSKLVLPDYKLNICREGFIYRGASLLNKLTESLRNETKLDKFKTGLREWVRVNITIKPQASFPSLTAGSRTYQPPPPPEPPPCTNTIVRYLVPLEVRPKVVKMRTLHHYFPTASTTQHGGPLHREQTDTAEHAHPR